MVVINIVRGVRGFDLIVDHRAVWYASAVDLESH